MITRDLYRSRSSFAQVSWEMVKELGGDIAAAALFDWIAWKCEPDHAKHVDGSGRGWYPISYSELSVVTGSTEKAARGIIKRLVDSGHVEVSLLRLGGPYDQTRSYAPLWAGVPERADGSARKGAVGVPKRADVPLIEDISFKDIPAPDPFDEFWDAYPIHKGKADARKAYAKAVKKVPHEVIVAGVRAYVASLGPAPDITKVKWAQGWLNAERWADEHITPSTAVLTSRQAQTADLIQQLRSEEGALNAEIRNGRSLALGTGR